MSLLRALSRLAFVILLAVIVAGILLHVTARLRQVDAASQSAPGKFVSGGDATMHYQEAGPAGRTTVVFVGGTGSWSGLWKAEMEIAAAAGHRAVAIDLPPFGYSSRPTSFDYTRKAEATRLVEALRQLHVGKVILVAHSFGAAAVVTAAASIPDKLVALMLVDPALGFTTPDATTVEEPSAALATTFAIERFRIVLGDLVTQPMLTKWELQRVIARQETATDEVVALYQQPLTLHGKSEEIGKWLADLLVVRDAEFIERPEFFRQIGAPVTLVWGERDEITPLWQADKLAKLLPKAKLLTIPGAGHVPQIEDPAAFRGLLQDFLRKPSGA